MTLPDVARTFEYWSTYPPLRDLVAAAVGFEIPKPEAEESQKYMTAEDFRRLFAVTGGRVPGMSPGP